MYKGLPIITNKISQQEQRGIPHHLLDNIGLEEETWVVGRFKREASRIIRDIRSRGKLPIVVGGTHYYINGLLFDNGVIDEASVKKDDVGSKQDEDGKPDEDGKSRFPVLNASTEEILKELRKVDPVMADRWHPNDRRKISRSLEIYLTTGRRASDIYEEQKLQKEESYPSSLSCSQQEIGQPLLFWVYSSPGPLNDRLNSRIDKMLNQGLMTEVSQMHTYLQSRISSGITVDQSKGIWQSIGFKEFEPYLSASPSSDQTSHTKELEALKTAGLERMKISTRQYAKYQVRWITHKTLPAVKSADVLSNLFLLDSTNVSQYRDNVVEKGIDITHRFLTGLSLPEPMSISKTASDVLSKKMEDSAKPKKLCQRTCELCKTTTVTEEAWEKHIKGRGHRRALKNKARRALVEGRRELGLTVAEADGDGEGESEDLGLDFALLDLGEEGK
jgi:tRNA dimethylallyltransferase